MAESLWDALGYGTTAHAIAQALDRGTELVLVEGPPGVGKSWMAAEIGELWELDGGSTVLVEGDFMRANASLYPFSYAMTRGPKRLRSVGSAVATATRAGELMLGTRGAITSGVQAAVRARDARKGEKAPFLGDAEQTVFFELERLAKKGPLLLIADNLHWWDASSIAFLSRLRDEAVWNAFPFLAGVRVLGVQTPEPYQSVAHPTAHEALLSPMTTARFDLPRVGRPGFEVVLGFLGASATPSDEVADAIYSISGGHLALAERCVRYVGAPEESVLFGQTDPDAWLGTLIAERIRTLGEPGKRAIALLRMAAMLGSTFRREEIFCASRVDEDETLQLLRYCRSEGLLEAAGGLDRFVHDVFRQHFLQASSTEKVEICSRLAGCLQKLRPAEYEIRCLNALGAEQESEAATFAVHAALQHAREGRPWTELPPAIREAMASGQMIPVTERFLEAFDLLQRAEFVECLAALDRLPRRLPTSLTAEADWLRAMALMSTRDERDRARGRLILESWSDYLDEEPEIGARLALQLLYGLFHVADKEPGWALERRIVKSLSARSTYDPAAEDALYVLDRCSAGLHPPDVVLVRVREAVAHFAPRDGGTVSRRPIEHFRCLLNLSASLIENARFDEACEVGSSLQQLLDTHVDGAFSGAGWAQANLVLAEYRAGRINAAQALMRQRDITHRAGRHSDPYFLEGASAVYAALAGDLDTASDTLLLLQTHLNAHRHDPEPSMVYMLGSNLRIVRFLLGEANDIAVEWGELRSSLEASNYMDRDILLRRHDLLADVFADGRTLSPGDFDRCLLDYDATRIGPLWRSFGYSFVLPALHMWREN